MTSAKPSKYRLAALPLVSFFLLAAMSLLDPSAARRGQPDPDEQQSPQVTRPMGTPLLALVSLKDQRVTIYDKDGAILHAPVSSGQTGYETPVGIYAVLQKEAEHYSNRYDDASMPFMQRITWTGVALHAGALPGYPASHGCIRLPYEFAQRLFPLTKLGMRVVVSRYDVAPSAISHPLLFKPAPLRDAPALVTKTSQEVVASDGDDKMKLGAAPPADLPPVLATRAATLQAIIQQKTAEADEAAKKADAARLIAKQKSAERARAIKALRVAETAKKRAEDDVADADRDLSKATSDSKATDEAKQKLQAEKDKAAAKLADATQKFEAAKAEFQPKIDDYEQSVADAKAAEAKRVALLAEVHAAERKMSPVSVFISRATQKLYVRQAFEPIFEAPITIRDPDKPIGTHIMTAVDYADGNGAMRWNVVSIGGRRAGDGGDDEVRDDRADDYYDDGWGRPRPRKSQKNEAGRSAEAAPTDVAAASAALDRISIPQDVVERISELVLPGSSLIVSDEPAHKETGKQTDFVVLISGEPQGGIKMRPKPRPEFYDDYYWGGGGGWGDSYGRRGRGGGYRGPVFQFW
jgi:L,D-transpeptidase catalytic domain